MYYVYLIKTLDCFVTSRTQIPDKGMFEGVIGNIYRYSLLVGGIVGMGVSGAGAFFGYELPEELMPLGLVIWLAFILGLGVGPLLAWRDR